MSSEFASNLAPDRVRVSSGDGCLEDEDETQLLLAAGQQDILVPKVKYLSTTLRSLIFSRRFADQNPHLQACPLDGAAGKPPRNLAQLALASSLYFLLLERIVWMQWRLTMRFIILQISCFTTAAFP